MIISSVMSKRIPINPSPAPSSAWHARRERRSQSDHLRLASPLARPLSQPGEIPLNQSTRPKDNYTQPLLYTASLLFRPRPPPNVALSLFPSLSLPPGQVNVIGLYIRHLQPRPVLLLLRQTPRASPPTRARSHTHMLVRVPAIRVLWLVRIAIRPVVTMRIIAPLVLMTRGILVSLGTTIIHLSLRTLRSEAR